jgi:hypothetical protein
MGAKTNGDDTTHEEGVLGLFVGCLSAGYTREIGLGLFPEIPKCLTLEKFQIDFASALWGDASPAASRKARGGEVWIVEEVWRSERPAPPPAPPLSLDTHQP